MGPEILQLLLLLLPQVSLENSGNPGWTWAEYQPQEVSLRSPVSRGQEDQAEEEHRMEGETFSVNCTYKPQEHENRWISWCKKLENGKDCGVPALEPSSNFSLSGKKYFSSYDSISGILTITMFDVRVNDSGVYQCVVTEEYRKKPKVFRKFNLLVSPAQTQSPYKTTQTTSEITCNNQVTNSSPKTKFLILGVVLSCLLLSVLLVVGILCARRIYQKAGKGDDSESWGEKSKGFAREMDSDENAEEIHYATVYDKSPREPTSAKIHTPVENAEYATITRN